MGRKLKAIIQNHGVQDTCFSAVQDALQIVNSDAAMKMFTPKEQAGPGPESSCCEGDDASGGHSISHPTPTEKR